MLKGTYDEAASFFRRAPVIDSKSVDAQIGIAWVLIANIADGWSNSVPQDQARAEELLLEATQESAIGASAHATFGLLRRLPNRLAEAQIAWETAIALDPNNATAFRQVGFTLIFSGQPEAAIPEFEKGLRLGPNEAGTPSACAGLGLRYLLVGQVEKAVDLLRKARADNTRLHYTHMLLAAALALKGDFEEAETALAHGIKLKPEIDSLARMRASLPYTNPAYVSLVEKTVFLGLRKAVTPEE
jgi:tetratricopeptide (TPR) repeat protein